MLSNRNLINVIAAFNTVRVEGGMGIVSILWVIEFNYFFSDAVWLGEL